jgi:hypothetical protein
MKRPAKLQRSYQINPLRKLEKDDASEDDQDSDLNPDEPAELSENDFDAIAPGGRHRVADRLYAMRRSSQPPTGTTHWGISTGG